MSTDAFWTSLAVAVAMGMTGAPCISAAGDGLAVVGANGQILCFSDSDGQKQLASFDIALPGRRVVDTYCVPSEKTLFVSTDDAKLYKLDLTAVATGYERVQTTNDSPFCAWYNRKEERPAWLHLGNERSTKAVRFRGADRRVHESQDNDIEFTKGFVFGMHIDGWKTSSALAAMGSDLAALPATYPDDQWIIVGRSKQIAAYLRKPAVPVKTGEPVTATILLQDRTRNQWRVETMDEYCQVSVFAEAAVLRGLYDIKGDKDPETGNDVQAKPSGKWYFYEPKDHRLTAHEFDPSWTVCYATARRAIISGNGQLLTLALDAPEHEDPEPLVELPTGFTVVTVCPF